MADLSPSSPAAAGGGGERRPLQRRMTAVGALYGDGVKKNWNQNLVADIGSSKRELVKGAHTKFLRGGEKRRRMLRSIRHCH